ncbi:MAG: ROK family protein [Clostridia bacterium]|nr:ROK family protein [Clostridia bacterium]
MHDYAIGIDVGGTHIKLGLFDSAMQLLAEQSFLTDKDATALELMDFLALKARALAEKAGIRLEDVRGIGAAFPSSIDARKGLTLESSNIVALNDQPVRDMLQQRLNLPVYVDNDGNVAALAEHRYGAGRGYDNMIYATLATGIGGGLILNGQLYRGMHGMAGEIGHMFVSDSTGYPCGCGVIGCVHSICSGVFMARYAMDRIKEGAESRILDYAGTLSNIDMVAVGRALQMNDPLALEVVNRGAEYLGRMFHSLNLIFDINIFVYGGGITNLGHRFTDRMIASYRHHSLIDQKYPAKFIPAELGGRAEIIGAALLVP